MQVVSIWFWKDECLENLDYDNLRICRVYLKSWIVVNGWNAVIDTLLPTPFVGFGMTLAWKISENFTILNLVCHKTKIQ
jgi:hypothetical protein